MTPEEQYPSTDDCADKLKAGDDGVLLCLINARERVQAGHSRSSYGSKLSGKLVVCAIGAVLAGDNLTDANMPVGEFHGHQLMAQIDKLLSDEAKQAIELLNVAALELHPEAEDYGSWSGPLEWVNQRWTPTGENEDRYNEEHDDLRAQVKTQVLAIYDHAIKQRQATHA